MGKVIKLNESDIKRIVKRVLTEQKFDYETIENLNDGVELLNIIRDNMGTFSDNEAVIEAAFIGLSKIPEFFKTHDHINIKHLFGEVSKSMNINKIYHKQSILKSLNIIADYLIDGDRKDIDPNDDWYDRPTYDWWKDVFKSVDLAL